MTIEEKELKKTRRKAKFRELKAAAKLKAYQVADWAEEHREVLMVTIPAIGIGGRFIAKRSNLNQERQLKDKYIYDRSAGHYWKLRKKPTQNQWAEIDRRKANGERLSDILMSMRLM